MCGNGVCACEYISSLPSLSTHTTSHPLSFSLSFSETHTRTHTDTDSQTHTHTCTYTHVHTHTPARTESLSLCTLFHSRVLVQFLSPTHEWAQTKAIPDVCQNWRKLASKLLDLFLTNLVQFPNRGVLTKFSAPSWFKIQTREHTWQVQVFVIFMCLCTCVHNSQDTLIYVRMEAFLLCIAFFSLAFFSPLNRVLFTLSRPLVLSRSLVIALFAPSLLRNLSLARSVAPSLAQTLARSLTCSLARSIFRGPPLTCSLTRTHAPLFAFSLSRTLALSHSRTLALSPSRSFALSFFLSIF